MNMPLSHSGLSAKVNAGRDAFTNPYQDLSFVGKPDLGYKIGLRGPDLSPVCLLGIIMAAFIVLIRNLVLAAILAWLGVEFAPADNDDTADNRPAENVIVSMLG
jgi:hypothetical protein